MFQRGIAMVRVRFAEIAATHVTCSIVVALESSIEVSTLVLRSRNNQQQQRQKDSFQQ